MRLLLRRAAPFALAFAFVSPPAAAQPAGTAQAPPAAARPKQKALPVTVTLSSNAEAHAAQVAYILESAVRRSLRHEFVDPVDKFDPDGVHVRTERRRKAEDAVAFGRKQYENLEEGLGIESFNRAITAFEESALWDTFRGLSQATVMRILVKWAEDQTVTRREIARLLAMDPRADFPEELTPPDLAAEVERAREGRKTEAKFALDVSTEPVASRVYVDGVYRGTTPTAVRGLTQGEHYLSLVAPGYQVVQKKVRVGPGATATETLVPAVRARPFLTFLERIQKGFADSDEVNASRVLARVCGADEVVIAGVRRETSKLKIEMHRIVAADGHAVAVESIEVLESDPDLAVKVDTLARRVLAKDRPRDEKGRPLGIRSGFELMVQDLASVSEEKVRLGVGIGAGVLVTTGLVLGYVAGTRETTLRGLTQLDPQVDTIAGSGRSMAIASDVVTGLGLAAGATWAWLQFGRKAKAKGDLAAPPVLEKDSPKQPEKKKEEKKRDDDVWDPWASADEAGPAWVRPTVGWGSVGMEVGF